MGIMTSVGGNGISSEHLLCRTVLSRGLLNHMRNEGDKYSRQRCFDDS